MIQKREAGVETQRGATAPWLLLVYQLPARPSNARVKTWRRLQKLGALPVRNSAYALPQSPQAREDLEWMKAEIAALGGQATVFAAEAVDSLSHDEIVAGFRAARTRDYTALRADAEKLRRDARSGRRGRAPHRERGASRLRERLTAIRELDFFHAAGRDQAEAALDALNRAGEGETEMHAQAGKERLRAADFRNRLWVTRPRPGVDRMSCAWLIRRFIDPRARFAFASAPGGNPRAVPFDMYGVEFGHQGSACSFETLVRRFGLASAAIGRIAQIVHDLDLKDAKHEVEEAAAVGRMIEGLREMHSRDNELLARGMDMFEALYRSFSSEGAGRKSASGDHAGTQRRVRSGPSS